MSDTRPPKASPADANLYMEICACLLAREGGEIIIQQSEVPTTEFQIWRRVLTADEPGGPGMEVRLIRGTVGSG